MISGSRTPLDYLFFIRPVLLPPVWTIALLGTVRLGITHDMSVGMWTAFFLQLSALFGGVYTLNQICDVESDRINRKLYFLPERLISIDAAWRFTIALDAAAIALAVGFGWAYAALTLAIVVLGILYSVGRRPWKNRLWHGLASNALGHGAIVYAMGFVLTGCPLGQVWQGAAAYTLAVGAVYLITTVPDAEGDMQTGKRTAAVAWGATVTAWFAFGLVLVAAAMAWWGDDRFLLWAALAAAPFFAIAAANPAKSGWAAKAAVAGLSIAAVTAYPLYLGLLISGFFATRLFFRWRFGISYPTFV